MPNLVTIYSYTNTVAGPLSHIESQTYDLNSLGVTNITALSARAYCVCFGGEFDNITIGTTASVGSTTASSGATVYTDYIDKTSTVTCTDINLIGGDWIATTVVRNESGTITPTNNVNLGK